MILFSRQEVVMGDPRETLPWVREIAEHVHAKSGLDVSVWSALTGAPLGTLAYTTIVDSRAQLSAAMQTFIEDDKFQDIVNRGRKFLVAPPEDSLINIVHVAGGETQRAGVGSLVSVHSAEVAMGEYVTAGTWAVEVAELVAAITGAPVMFGTNVAGGFGRVQWVQTAPDIATQEAWDELVNENERYMAKLSEIGGMFVEGSGNRLIGRRIF